MGVHACSVMSDSLWPHVLYNQSFIGKHLDFFQFFDVVEKYIMALCVYICMYSHTFFKSWFGTLFL